METSRAFAVQLLTGRWFMIFSSFLIMSVSGASYMFALYSRDIKSVLGYDQSTLNLLSFFKDLGSNIGILSGLLNEVTPPSVVLSLGALLNFFGYFMVWLAVSAKLPAAATGVPLMAFFIFVGANSHCSTNTAVVVTSVKNFPGSRGIVIGILSGYLGLSAAVITQLYYAYYGDDSKSLLLLMAWLPTVTSFAFLPVIRHHRGIQQPDDSRAFYKERGGLYYPPGNIQHRHGDFVLRDGVWAWGYPNDGEQSVPDRDVSGVPYTQHNHIRILNGDLDLFGEDSARGGFGVHNHKAQVPKTLNADIDPCPLVRRTPPSGLRRPKRPIRGLNNHWVLLRSELADPVLHNF
ncbi:protein NUCLEAR FUSION DEFECTIVE 4-like [Senna tora]|uniref:Protein NUCLEAR FUSION DEFECTIVE 4-like n=1 Tax=Senna tora TaxID=362788 RepID=A0A834TEC8_9FABA|nr:protein NUCLEAR FUSION DEFECTIVE 4-like [Senna tora]